MNDNFYLDPGSETYRQVIFDVIRIFYPEFEWAENTGQAKRVVLEKKADCWRIFFGTAEAEFSVEGLDENECRRCLKQQIYSLFTGQEQQKGSQWGIMTGIRPTKIVHRLWDQKKTEEEIRVFLQEEYLTSPEKTELLLDVTKRQRPFLLSSEEARKKVSLYLSIPFCPTRCAYCSFPSFTLPKPEKQDRYVDYLIKESLAVTEALKKAGKTVQTVYIGGGTPTSLSAGQLDRLLTELRNMLPPSDLEEFTVEAGRPDTITEEKLQILHDHGVGRISINPQSFSQKTLDRVGRKHTVAETEAVYHMARAVGFDSVNMDLIAGLNGETVEDFAHTLSRIHALKPENLTVHTLAIKKKAALHNQKVGEDHAERVNGMYAFLSEWLKGEDYQPYYLYRQKHMVGEGENTGFCLPGKESLYNIQMMEERQTIFGLGVGSASKFVNADDWTLHQKSNPKDLFFYEERIDELIARKLKEIEELSR